MKKNVFLWVAVFAVGAMSSCSVDKVVDQAEARYIGFDAFANKVTRNKPADFPHETFGVWGAYNSAASVVFTNKTVTYQSSDGSWSYGTPEPWVSGQEYEFAAIAPYVNGASYDYGTDKYTLGQITVDATEASQIDYMTATPINNHSSGTSPVSFDFNHILSKIDFKFQPKTTSADNTHWLSDVKIDIKSIRLSSVATTKSYTNGAWVDATAADGSFSVTLSDNNSTTYEPSSTADPKVSQLTDKFSWLVVPQTDTEASNRALTIKFDVFTKDATGAYNVKVLTDKEATVEIANNWVANTVYTYTVYIGSDILGPNAYITFDVASANWSTPNQESDLNVPTTQP